VKEILLKIFYII